jgi:cysteine-rich repeat protein
LTSDYWDSLSLASFSKIALSICLTTGLSYADNTRQEITGISGTYDWRWTAWAPSDATLFTASQISTALDTATVTAVGDNGDATVIATAQIVENGTDTDTMTGSADVTAFLCENPWPSLSQYPWSDDAAGATNGFASAGTSGYMNFSLGYCRDYGDDAVSTDDLPSIASVVLAPALPASTHVLKEYLFEIDPDSSTASSSSAGDAIGVRVLSNADHLSPMDWYTEQGFTGSPSETTIDGLQALTDERSTYIGAPNATAGGLYSNIVVISYNEGASEETQNVYEQIIANVTFLTNVADSAVCSDDGSACSSDLDCGGIAVCGSDKLKITRDTQRLADLQNLSLLVTAYGEENMTCSDTATQTCSSDADCPADETCEAIVPALSSGTDVRSLSSSAWSSWNETLGGALDAGPLPTDPLNTYTACSGYDSATCVNTTTDAYICPSGSHVYHYRAIGDRSYGLGTDLEYRDLNWVDDLEDASNDTVSFSTSGYCSNTVYGTSSLCGDGIIGASETCETGDTNAIACTTADGAAGSEDQVCNISCTGWTLPADAVCTAGGCGNGVIEAGESCDDGSLNGEYGYCGALCTYTGAEYCGDGLISGGEACDCGDASATSRVNSRPYGGTVGTCAGSNGTYSATAATTCAWDCSGSASYCGDDVVDTSAGESCDGNADTTASAICADGMTECTSDADCVGHGDVCGGGLNSACPATGYLCSGGTFDGYMCASPSWDLASNLVTAYYCETVGGGTCAETGTLYPVVHTRSCDSGDASTGTCGWNTWNFCNTNGAICGNGVVDGDEECDDGNDVATDSCTTECTLNVCGDGYLYSGSEECDEGGGNGDGCVSAYGSTCTACSTSCHYTVSSGDFCGDGDVNGDEYCDGSDVPYLWYNGYDSANIDLSWTTDGTCDTVGETRTDAVTGVTYTCRAVGMCNGGDYNGDYCTQSAGIASGDDTTSCGYSGSECVFPVCGADCASTCPMSETTTSLLMTSNQPGDPASASVDLYSYDASNTSSLPNAATITVPACTTAGNLVADVDFSNVTPPDVYVVFVTDVSGSMSTALGSSTRIAVARDSIKSAIGTVFDELGSGAYISLVSFDSAVKSTVAFTGESGESTLDAAVDLYAPGASTATNLGLDQAKTYLDAVTDITNVAKFIVLLSDGAPNSETSVDASALAILKASGIEVYSITVNTDPNLISDMNRWSSNSVCSSSATSLTATGGGCSTAENNSNNNIDYSYSGSTTSEVSGAYESIIDSIINGTASVTSSDGSTVVVDTGSVSDSHNIVLPWPSNFSCDGVSEQSVPIQINFRGEGEINVSNVRVDTCAP